MSGLTIYGANQTRSARVLWMANELGLDYEHVPTTTKECKAADYLLVNPNGRVPAIDDNGLCLFESLAINLYLAQKHGGPLAPQTPEEWGRTYQWSFWAMTEMEPHLLTLLLHRLLLPEEQRKPERADKAEADLQGPLEVLEKALAGRDWLASDHFTVADLNLAAVLSWSKFLKVDLSAYPKTTAWLDTCLKRDAFRKARG